MNRATKHFADYVMSMITRPEMYSDCPLALDHALYAAVQCYLIAESDSGPDDRLRNLWRGEILKLHPNGGARAMSLADVGNTAECARRHLRREFDGSPAAFKQVCDGWRRIWTTITDPVTTIGSVK